MAADLLCVLVFAFAGKTSHEADASSWVTFAIAWPYAVALLFGHLGLLARGYATRRLWPAGGVILVVTYVVGMLLRALSGRGIAIGFLVVAALFLALTLLGWRLVARLVMQRRSSTP